MNKDVRVDARERYDERLQNVFSDCIRSEVERRLKGRQRWFMVIYLFYYHYGSMLYSKILYSYDLFN